MPSLAASDIFCEVYVLPPEERAQKICELVGDDAETIGLVLNLLAAYERNPDFLELPAGGAGLAGQATDFEATSLEKGGRLGPY
ncbi:MAG: hypothetical protein ACKO85_08680, partial [Isosphaeraceae bacterium]